MPDYSKVYLIRVAARAARMPVEVLDNLSARDFTVVTNRVQNFLMASDSEESDAESETETPVSDRPTSFDA
ncbi:hypothetical protein FACS1894216_21610 [Synergistales bacterium]|nr:hypothetical protein FACS1894216_21610 [Synergistales bacterium]